MPHINLLPWREAARKEAQQRFVTILVVVLVAAFASMFALSSFYSALKDGQNVRNNFLSREIQILDRRIAEIRELDKKKESLQQRMRLIEELQSNRNLGTQIMDEVAKIVPSGVYFTTLERRGDAIQVTGKSESNNRLSTMIRQVESSYLLENASLQGIVAGEEQSRLLSDFNMQFNVKSFDEIGEAQE
ncbi:MULTISPECIES: PilN domain-containing protein [Pseudoalteromonas]|uniref:Pilus assembly protein PilN n=2 Tax=Pseudoalteromonas TaxID=53246 RepID=A0A0F4PUP7_9GAMM|nr:MULTISPECIES: PilN domain-containing protein [Pseudoalteromonas]KJY95087.1 pilus assembly protein PilN [Pseudoalteromonas ruthenica]KJY98768.1 pilus assembly protein PilN [Pseudoalteromonas ruthenica]MCF2861957.1 PilN domain-containing protein [Pseudoalteromonas sp. CNAT2-18]MCG7543794.1 PilN domain-containing protein [Pseudoalteromonas sp. MM17-2]MCG7559670.1 PilN domain-containing protein [Pseudoalteromonas sp. CNAT2-18.1]|tara:strand:- start:3855 stop:4421 length:567 start_codon:yes stop_codon:yes gene_type:complete